MPIFFLNYSASQSEIILLLSFLCLSGRPMVVSSGMQSMETMRRVYNTVKKHNENFAILQCTSAYPLEAEDVNLRVIAVRQMSLDILITCICMGFGDTATNCCRLTVS